MEKKRIAIIGGGIAAYGMAHQFANLNKNTFAITLYDGSSLVPACSYASTAITALRGTTKGLSPLGDLIVDAYHAFENFHETYKPIGVSETFEEHLWPIENTSDEKILKRHPEAKLTESIVLSHSGKLLQTTEKAYVIVPEIFLKWYEEELKDKVNLKKEFVHSLQKNEKNYEINNQVYDYVIFCTGYKTQWFENFFTEAHAHKKVSHAKPVAGTYLSFDKNDFNPKDFKNNLMESFSIAYDNSHLIYQKEMKRILIGSTTNNLKDHYLPAPEIQEIYQKFKDCFKWTQFPEYSTASFHTGIRHKGQQRMPFWGKIDDDGAFAIHSLYKNGYSFYLLAAAAIEENLRQ